jgi:4-hydroxybenzoyl-CoA reductase subunit beta
MLRLPVFEASSPRTLEEAVALLKEPGSRLIAGGTDLLPNLKHRLDAPSRLVSLDRVESLKTIRRDGDALVVGAAVTLSELAANSEVQKLSPSLSLAAGLVASPLIRNMGTIGGNVNLDTRCRYVNQTEFWRSAIGGCLKSEGDVCHVVPKGRSCVAAMSSDCVPVLISLGASFVQVGPDGEREVRAADYYNTDGVRHTNCGPGEVTAAIRLPISNKPTRATYAKWTVRKSVDFPLISIAMRFELAADRSDAEVVDAALVLGALAARPKELKCTTLVGKGLASAELADALAELVYKQGKTLDNIPYEAGYRRKMLPVYAKRALKSLIQEG